MLHKVYKTNICVVGGGLAGLCAAIAAARKGAKVVLVQDRPVLGGNASSEIRMWVCGSHGKDNRETGIIEELMLENYYQNTRIKYSIWDSVLYEKAMSEKNITLLLNSSCLNAEMKDKHIVSITAWQSNAETFHEIHASYFIDCSGDSILAPLTNADFRYGREAKSTFCESIPPDIADSKTMGMSCLFQIRECNEKVSFTPPSWAYKYKTDADLPYKDHDINNNFWWIELGGESDCIHDTDKCRDELLKICYGVWDHIKNYGDHGAANWEMEWIGFLPGKRESRRYVGLYTVSQNDVESEGHFSDIVAYGGWTMDDHFPEGFYYSKGHPTIYHPAPQPWGIPLRVMISNSIDNLLFAGRNISVTHAALSSSRVMATCAILGQAIGTTAALAVRNNVHPADLCVTDLQQQLMWDDCYIPWHKRNVPKLTLQSKCSHDIVRNGIDRGQENCCMINCDEEIIYTFNKDEQIREIRLIFDSDLNRSYKNMPCNYPLIQPNYRVPQTLIRSYKIIAKDCSGKIYEIYIKDNHQRFVIHTVNWQAKTVKFIPLQTWGVSECRIFSFELR